MLKLHVTSSRFCLYLLNKYHFIYTFSLARTEAHTHKHTCIISTQEEWRQPGTGAWLRGAEERLLLETKALHTRKKGGEICQKKSIFTDECKKKGFEHIKFPAKLLGYFLRSCTKQHQSINAVLPPVSGLCSIFACCVRHIIVDWFCLLMMTILYCIVTSCTRVSFFLTEFLSKAWSHRIVAYLNTLIKFWGLLALTSKVVGWPFPDGNLVPCKHEDL